MVVKYHKSGAELLLRKIEKVSGGAPLTESDIIDIMSEASVDIWICAYESWITSARGEFENIMKSLHKEPPGNLSNWGISINNGIRAALEDTEQLQANLALMSEFSWAQAEWAALKYLPKNTPIKVDVFATIDGFNGGMYRGDKVYISILYVTSSTMRASSFSHEFHHVGMEHWWKQHPLVKEYDKRENTQEYWVLRLFEYMVSEGIANAFCSPWIIAIVDGEGELIEAHNAIIEDYENRWNEFHNLVESIIDDVAKENLENVKKNYEKLTLDMSGKGHPIGHFLSGRFVQEMDKAEGVSRNQIIDLVANPFSFFHLYNKAAKERGLREFSSYILSSLDSLIDEMRGN